MSYEICLLIGSWQENYNCSQKIFFSDEAHFVINGYVNRQACRILSKKISRKMLEKLLYPVKAVIWFLVGWPYCSFFFQYVAGKWNTIQDNGKRLFIERIIRYGYAKHIIPENRCHLPSIGWNNKSFYENDLAIE